MKKIIITVLCFVLSMMTYAQELKTFKGHKIRVHDVKFSPDGKMLVSGGADNAIKLWNVQTGAEIRTFLGHTSYVNSVCFSPDGKTIASGSKDDNIKLWNVQTGAEIMTFIGHKKDVNSICFSSDGKLIISGDDGGSMKLWEVETGNEYANYFEGHYGAGINSVSFNSKDSSVVTAGKDGWIKTWAVKTGQKIDDFPKNNYQISSAYVSTDGKFIIYGSDDHSIGLITIKGNYFPTLAKVEYSSKPIFSPDGKFVAFFDYKIIKIIEVATKKEVRIFEGHREPVASLCFSPDGKLLVSGSDDATLRLWDVSDIK